MAIKVENRSSLELPKVEEFVDRAVACLPAEHLRGLGRIVLVDRIEDPRLPRGGAESLPALYRPRVPGASSASGEIALPVLFPQKVNAFKRWAARSQAPARIAQAVFSLPAQHYIVTIASRKLKSKNLERNVLEYVERYFKVWRDRQTGWRARLFRPLVPYFERWQKSLQRYQREQARKKLSK
jgi:hypothetical protein